MQSTFTFTYDYSSHISLHLEFIIYRTGSPGQLGLRVAGFPGHWVAGSQIVTQFHIWYKHVAIHKTEST